MPSFGCIPCGLVISRALLCPALTPAERAGGLHLVGDRPDEARQLTRDCGSDHCRRLSRPGELAISPTQSFLRLPRRVANRAGQTLLSQQKLSADPCREPVAARGLDQHATCRAVPGLGDTALTRRVPPLECSDGTKPRYAISWRGLAKRVISPSSAL